LVRLGPRPRPDPNSGVRGAKNGISHKTHERLRQDFVNQEEGYQVEGEILRLFHCGRDNISTAGDNDDKLKTFIVTVS